ncbi:MAG: TetR/AcrR family transcriptional regulator [bacterium]|nr:TetR/AcrR family transcriptional regulator [bacterium]
MSSAEPREPEDERKRVRFADVRVPKPVLPVDTERKLTPRQQEVLDQLEDLVEEDGLAELTMGKIAAHMGCSLRTLYGISPSKDELVLAAVDRNLRRIGRAAIDSLDPEAGSLDMLRAYLDAANVAVEPAREVFARELASLPGLQRLIDAHEDYLTAITKSLLDRAVEEDEISTVDTAALAHVLAGLARDLAGPEVREVIAESPRKTASEIVEIILAGLTRG